MLFDLDGLYQKQNVVVNNRAKKNLLRSIYNLLLFSRNTLRNSVKTIIYLFNDFIDRK